MSLYREPTFQTLVMIARDVARARKTGVKRSRLLQLGADIS